MNRRTLLFAIPLLATARLEIFASPAQTKVSESDIDRLLDTTYPERHCQMEHDHSVSTFDDWEGSLKWSSEDCGHNEGSGPVIRLAVENGLSYPALMRGCPQSEEFIPEVEEARKNPDTLDRYSGWVSPSQLATLKQMFRDRRPIPEILAAAPEKAVGEAWRRRAMMRFAAELSKKDSLPPAAAIATASQWHNCHAFKCLLRHPNEICDWLKKS